MSGKLCPVWGDCRLQDLAYRYQVSTEYIDHRPTRYPMETVNPFIVGDFSRCIQCGRCVQACPVGALVEKDAQSTGRPWETRRVRTTCSYCGVGCQLYLHVKENRVVKVNGGGGYCWR